MKKVTEKEINSSLAQVINENDSIFIIFSGISSFGHKLIWEPSLIPEKIVSCLMNFIGKKRTLIFPTFTINFAKTRKFDIEKTLSINGTLSDEAISNSNFFRTSHPMYSYSIYGKLSNELKELNTSTAWGDNSVMSWLTKKNAKILILGEPWHTSCSILHHAEELTQVPYRYYKKFKGDLFVNGKFKSKCSEIVYSRSKNIYPIWDHTQIYTRLISKNKIFKSNYPYFPIESTNMKDYVDETLNMLLENPYAYIKNVTEVKNWVENSKKNEISELSIEEVPIL